MLASTLGIKGICLIALLSGSDDGDRDAVQPLVDKKVPDLALLAKDLESDSVLVREEAEELLGSTTAEEAWPHLPEALHADLPEARRAALRLVRKLRCEKGQGVVLKILRQDRDAKVRREAVHALASLRLEKAVPHLKSAASLDQEIFVRRAAINELGTIGGYEATCALVDLLEDAISSGNEYLTGLTSRALTTATGRRFGENIEGWRHLAESMADAEKEDW